MDPLHTGSLAASASPQPPRASTKHLFSAATGRLWQRLAPAKNTLENRPEPAKRLIWTQPGVCMRDLHPAGSPPARKLGLCAPRGAPERHRRSPSCARRVRKGRVSGVVGRVGALKSCPNAGGRADMPDMPNQPGRKLAVVALWRAGGRAQQGARWPPALSQRSPRAFQRLSAPSRRLLNLPLRLRCWHP